MTDNLYTSFHKLLDRSEKERLLQQRGVVIWMTGLSGSGKTTIAAGLEKKLFAEGRLTQVLDGDNVRTGLNSDLGFSESDRRENIRRIAETAKLFAACGVITVCCFVSPTHEMRALARQIVGEQDFVNVFISTSAEECERRDVKGLYAKARKGEIRDFTGVNAPFEKPCDAQLEIDTGVLSLEESVNKLYEFIRNKITSGNE